jgi:hypothetical protein
MVCSISCSISLVFIIGMIYFYNSTSENATVRHYKQQLNTKQRVAYDKIAKERLTISIQGYILGFILSLFIIFLFNKKIKPSSVVCLVLATSFLTNYFYYTLSPKSDWMLNHVESREQAQAWLKMYQTMQYYYHAGLVLGILGVGVFAYAFRC